LIRENPYMQYFLGLDAFSHKAVFDPSLFVSIRKRLGLPEFDEMTNGLIERVEHIEAERGKKKR
jgi:transposase, IS5 family